MRSDAKNETRTIASIPIRAQSAIPERKARGALSHVPGRFESVAREAFDDGWTADDEPAAPLETQVTEERVRSLIQRNQSPDLPFELSVNPYRGCEHGCIYCYARPAHAYLELSPGLDFESRLFAKVNAAEVLRAEIGRRGYVCSPISIGANTDCYQPAERRYGITRKLIEVLAECGHPLTMVTKSALVERDLDLLGPMGRANLAKVFVTVTTLERRLARRLEPRAPAPQRRLDTIRALAAAGVPVGVMMAPVIPALNDTAIEESLAAAAEAGATMAGYQMLRLPNELKELFREWLAKHVPQRAAHVMSLVHQLRGGRDNDPRFGTRMTGTGNFADLIAKRFELACRRQGLNGEERGQAPRRELDCSRFRRPDPAGQMALF
ncbi:MAG: PA0069 family radical SAM protein [bacterium]